MTGNASARPKRAAGGAGGAGGGPGLGYVARRTAQSAATLVAISVVVFTLMVAIGDPVATLLPRSASAADRARLRAEYGLDRPVAVQYFMFVGRLAHGDLGLSYRTGRPVADMIAERVPATMELALAALALATLIGVPLGIWAGVRPEAWTTRFIMNGSLLGISLPTFWIGLIFIMYLAVETSWMPGPMERALAWIPASGRGATREAAGAGWSVLTVDGWAHLFLPALTLALHHIALLIRLLRSELGRTLRAPFIRVARAYGFAERRIVGRFALRNALIPVITVTGVEFGQLVAFSVVTETVFNWPGLGPLLMDSVGIDRPLVLAYLLLTGGLFLVINFLVDLTYALVDPRIRLAEAGGGAP